MNKYNKYKNLYKQIKFYGGGTEKENQDILEYLLDGVKSSDATNIKTFPEQNKITFLKSGKNNSLSFEKKDNNIILKLDDLDNNINLFYKI